jgi:hypothetical protein
VGKHTFPFVLPADPSFTGESANHLSRHYCTKGGKLHTHISGGRGKEKKKNGGIPALEIFIGC